MLFGGVVMFGDVLFGEVELGDVIFGDVAFGEVAFGDVALGDVLFGEVEFGDVMLFGVVLFSVLFGVVALLVLFSVLFSPLSHEAQAGVAATAASAIHNKRRLGALIDKAPDEVSPTRIRINFGVVQGAWKKSRVTHP